MKRRLLSILLAIAMVFSTIAALPVSAAVVQETPGTIEVGLNKDNQVDFENAFSGAVTVSFSMNMSVGTGNVRLWLPVKGADRGSALPCLQITESGTIYAQQATNIGKVTPGAPTAIVWVYDTATGSYTVSVNGGAPSAAISCGAQSDVGAFAYKTINEKTVTITDLTVSAEADTSINIPQNADSQFNLEQAYTGTVKLTFDLTVSEGDNNVRLWFPSFGGGRDDSQPFFAVNPEGKVYAKHASGEQQIGTLTFGAVTKFELIYDVAGQSYTLAMNNGTVYGPYTVASTQANLGAIAYKTYGRTLVLDNIVVEEVVGPAQIPDLNIGVGGEQDAWLPTPFTGDVKVSFDMTATDDAGGKSNAFIYIMKASGNETGSINFQAQGLKLWAQAAESAGRVTSGTAAKIEIYYNTDGTDYSVYVDGAKTGTFSIGDTALGNIGGIWVKNKNNTTAPFVMENIVIENATEPSEGGDDEPEAPYEYDNTGFDLPKTDEVGVTYPDLEAITDIKKSDIPLGGDFKGTGEDLVNIEFDLELAEGYVGGTIGYGSAQFQDAITHWSDMVLMIQFLNPADYEPNDTFNIRNGGTYVSAGQPWQLGTSHFKVSVDTKLKKYSVWYTAPGAAEAVKIAEDYDYRGDTASMTESIGLMTFEGVGATIKNHRVYGAGYSYVAPAAAKVVEGPRTEPTTLTVGPNGQYSSLAKALAKAIPGDVIEIDAAGDYLGVNSNASIGVENITIKGVNGTPVFGYADRSASVPVTAHKGIWVAAAKDLTVENIKFQNAHDANEQDGNNYAGIRMEPVANSTVIMRNCYFTNCDNGSLVGAASGMTVKMINCEFNDNGFGLMKDGHYSTQEHGMYMGMIENFYFDHSISRQIKAQGHLVKTRAANNYILYSYIAEENTNGSHISNSNIDIPEGGNLYVIGSVLQQGVSQADLGNSRMISYAAEGANNADTLVVFANNTIVNQQSDVNEGRVAIFLHQNNNKTYSTENAIFVNNVYQGYRLADDTVPVVATIGGAGGEDKTAEFFSAENGNHIYNLSKAGDPAYAAANDPKFVDAANFDYHLQEGSPLIDKGIAHDPVNGVSLVPEYQLNMAVVAQVGTASQGAIAETRTMVGSALDIGAFEYGNVPAVDPTPVSEYFVGPDKEYKTLNEVVGLLKDGDTVYVDGGYDYPERVTIKTPNVTIVGVGAEKPNFNPSVSSVVNGIFVLEADGIVLENLKITGDVYRDHNNPDWGNTSHDGKEADGRIFRGIFNAGNNIVIRNCDVSHCAQGIQSNNNLAGSLTIEYSNIHENGRGWGEHNLYIATNNALYPEATLIARYNYIHDANCDSNGLKTRALNNKVYYNWFENNSQEFELISMGNDEATLRQYVSSGDVVGNVFVKTMDGRFQGQLGRFGGDGTGAGSFGRYRFVNNTFAFLRSDVDWNYNTLRLHMGIESVELYNNVFYAPNVPAEFPIEVISILSPNWASGEHQIYGSNNWVSTGTIVPEEFENTMEGMDPYFVDVEALDFHLAKFSPLIGKATANTVKTWEDWTNGDYSNKNNQIVDPLTEIAYEPINKASFADTPVASPRINAGSIGAYDAVEAPENYVGAMLVTKPTVQYPDDVKFDVVLTPVEGLNVLTLSFAYDPSELTFKEVELGNELLEEFYCEVNEEDGVINALYLVKNETISTDENTVFASAVFTAKEEGMDKEIAVTLTNFVAAGIVDDTSVQYDSIIEMPEAITIVFPEAGFDLNGDGDVNLADLSLLAVNFNKSGNDIPNGYDVERNDIIDVADMVAMVSAIRAAHPELLPTFSN